MLSTPTDSQDTTLSNAPAPGPTTATGYEIQPLKVGMSVTNSKIEIWLDLLGVNERHVWCTLRDACLLPRYNEVHKQFGKCIEATFLRKRSEDDRTGLKIQLKQRPGKRATLTVCGNVDELADRGRCRQASRHPVCTPCTPLKHHDTLLPSNVWIPYKQFNSRNKRITADATCHLPGALCTLQVQRLPLNIDTLSWSHVRTLEAARMSGSESIWYITQAKHSQTSSSCSTHARTHTNIDALRGAIHLVIVQHHALPNHSQSHRGMHRSTTHTTGTTCTPPACAMRNKHKLGGIICGWQQHWRADTRMSVFT